MRKQFCFIVKWGITKQQAEEEEKKPMKSINPKSLLI